MRLEQIPRIFFSIYGRCKNVVRLNEKSKSQLGKYEYKLVETLKIYFEVNWFKHFINGFQRAV